VIRCIDLESGATVWSQNGLQAGSLLWVGGKLLILTGNGELVLVEVSPAGYTELARSTILTARCWAPLAFARGKFYARNSAGDLVCKALPFTAEESPRLAISPSAVPEKMEISWPSSAGGYRLEASPIGLIDWGWTNVPDVPASVGGWNVVTNAMEGKGKTYRLIKP
jgi:hypothetical protein